MAPLEKQRSERSYERLTIHLLRSAVALQPHDLGAKVSGMKIIDVAELTPTDSRFVDLPQLDGEPLCWKRFSALPRNSIERRITRPRISRYRAAREASEAGQDALAIISHLPLMTLAVSNALSLRRASKTPHLAFSFNFTKIPTGLRSQWFRHGLASVDKFAVYTEFERELYSSEFDIPIYRFSRIDWTQEIPIIGNSVPDSIPREPFVAAIGGEGRDYKLILDLARAMPHISFVIIARPNRLFDDLPRNVRLFCNIPAETCWAIAARAAFVMVPLLDTETCCGHITLVSARLAGIPILTSRSKGTREYSEGYSATLIANPGALEEWVKLLAESMPLASRYKEVALKECRTAQERHDRQHWVKFVGDYLRDLT